MKGLYETLFGSQYPLPSQMSVFERLAMIAVLEHLKPSIAIEVGTAQGGSLQVLAAHAEKVYSLEVDHTVSERLSQFTNVEFRIGSSAETLPAVLTELHEAKTPCSFILIDGNHATAAVQQDIHALLSVSPLDTQYVMFHDSFNPDCRTGIRTAGWENSPHVWWVELDFVPGVWQPPDHPTFPRQMWGGFAMAYLSPQQRPGPFRVYTTADAMFQQIYRASAHWPE